jgi:hypothetical protein
VTLDLRAYESIVLGLSPPSNAFVASFAVAAVCSTRRSMVQRPARLESYVAKTIGSAETQGTVSQVMENVFQVVMLSISIQASDVLAKFGKLGNDLWAGKPDKFDLPEMETLARGQADVMVVECDGAAPSDVHVLLAGWVKGELGSWYALPFELVWVILDDGSVVARFGRTGGAVRVLFDGQGQNDDLKVKYAGYRVLPRTVEHRPSWKLGDFNHRLM